MPNAIIVGATGQDGTILFDFLKKKEYILFGIGRRTVITHKMRWDNVLFDIRDFDAVSNLVKKMQPDEIYHLAAFHHSSQDHIDDMRELFNRSYEVNVLSLFNFLEATRQFSPHTKLFYAASSHIFGRPLNATQDENTPINPLTIYGMTKSYGVFLCRMYRLEHNIFVSVGILYNHESWLRGEQFVSQKIVKGAINCKKNPQNRLTLGDLAACIDWGYAPDYIEAMYKIVTLPNAEDFIIATGEKHTVREFAQIAFESLGLDWKDFVEEREEIITRPAIIFVGNPAKLISKTGWKRSLTFSEMVRTLVEHSGEYHER
jgi:GDPmannose 4,6-dehydratase